MAEKENNNKLIYFCYFLIITSFVYVFSGITQVNLPLYYPVLREWHIEKLKDAVTMGFYSKVGFSLILGTLGAYFAQLITKAKVNTEGLVGFTKAAVAFGVLFFVAEEWHKWGIEKMKLDTEKLFINNEFWLFIIVTILAFILLVLSTKEKK